MSSSQHTNAKLNLVTDKICRLVTRSNKMAVGDLAAKPLAHDIAMTLVSAFAQHGNATTSLSPLLLSCTADIWDNSGLNGKLVLIPDWNNVSDHDPASGSTLCSQRQLVPTPEVTIAPKYKLFVPGNGKCWALTHKPEDSDVVEIEATEPALKKQKSSASKPMVTKAAGAVSRSLSTKKSKVLITKDDDEVLANKVILVNAKVIAGPSMKPGAPDFVHAAEFQQLVESSPTDAASNTERLFSVQCKHCIKDDIACTVVLRKKAEDALTDGDAEGEVDSGSAEPPVVTTEYVEDMPEVVVLEPAEQGPSQPVDNDVDMEVQHVKDTMPQPLAQPSNLDIIYSIQAMRQDFVSLLKHSDNHSEAIRQEVHGQVTTLEASVEQQFLAMVEQMHAIHIQCTTNTVNIGHMANVIKNMTHTTDISAFAPPTGPSTQGHPYGEIPSEWVAQLLEMAAAGQLPLPSVSQVGKLFTTAWDESRGPRVGGPDTAAGFLAEASGGSASKIGDK
ncbi:hypothetical protein BDR05DRAFT_953413 [Suillus weaverae]|nr:hypothetical protein BDR05DRAFT_953413 [Suillus weaverae]